jgi:hypothetical protein
MGGAFLETCIPEGWTYHIRAARTEQLDKCVSQAAAVYFHTSLAICLTVYGPNNCHFEGVTKFWVKCLNIKQQRSKLHNQEFYMLFTAHNIVRVNQLTRALWPEKVRRSSVSFTAPSSSSFVLSNAEVHVHARVRRPHFTRHIRIIEKS